MNTVKWATMLALAALLTAGCGSSSESGTAETTAQRPNDQLIIDVTIEGGEVTPTNERFSGRVGEPIRIRVNSDAADELHVHSIPEHTFRVEPRAGQTFEFTVDVPGQVEIELHELHRTIATVQVRQ